MVTMDVTYKLKCHNTKGHLILSYFYILVLPSCPSFSWVTWNQKQQFCCFAVCVRVCAFLSEHGQISCQCWTNKFMYACTCMKLIIWQNPVFHVFYYGHNYEFQQFMRVLSKTSESKWFGVKSKGFDCWITNLNVWARVEHSVSNPERPNTHGAC
jgi:hypothetical protein